MTSREVIDFCFNHKKVKMLHPNVRPLTVDAERRILMVLGKLVSCNARKKDSHSELLASKGKRAGHSKFLYR